MAWNSSTERFREYQGRAWRWFGEPVRPSKSLVRFLTHSTRTRLSSTLVGAHLRVSARSPVAPELPSTLNRLAKKLTDDRELPVAWIVGNRPRTSRTILGGVSAAGDLLGITKIGRSDDAALRREAFVLTALEGLEREVILPTLTHFFDDGPQLIVGTCFPPGDPSKTPYCWGLPLFDALRVGLESLHEALKSALDNCASFGVSTVASGDSDLASGIVSHGDFTPWNVFFFDYEMTPRLGVIDFEDVAFRPSWWDGATFVVQAWREGRVHEDMFWRGAGTLGVKPDHLMNYMAWALEKGRRVGDRLVIAFYEDAIGRLT